MSLGLSATDFVLYIEYNHNVSASETISTDNYARIEINLMLSILIYGLLNGVKNLPVYNASTIPSFGY